MRKRTLIFILFFATMWFAQAQKYQITYTGYAEAEPCDPDPVAVSYDRISLNKSGSASILLMADCNDLVVSVNNEITIINFLPTQVIKKKYTKLLNGDIVVDELDIVDVNFDHCSSKTLFSPNSTLNVDIEPYTQINSQPVNNTLCEVTLSVDESGFAPEVYVWQYYDNISSQWIDFPTFLQGQYMITFTLDDLFGSLASNYINTSIQFRMQKYCSNKYTNIVTYTMISCSPQLLSFAPLDTQCSYSSDGGFTANFDRDLNAGETLIMTLYEIDGGGNEILINQQSTTTLGIGNTYQWPLPQPAGAYLIKYQTENGGVYSSLETSGQFTIGNPLPVTFSGTKQNDVYCFNGSDGSIQLNASGGVGSFQYQINSGSWVLFSNTNTHIITSLPQGNYNIKVQDTNGCTERN